MLTYLSENLGTVITALILLAIVTGIVVKLIRDKKRGKPLGCDCSCSECPSMGRCGDKNLSA